MNRRDGMIYTSFAVLASAVLLFLAFMPLQGTNLGTGGAERIGEASFFLDSVLKDTDRSLEIATRRALTGSTNYIVETGNRLEEPEENVTSALVNGTISGLELNSTGNASLEDWKSRVGSIASRSGYSLSIELDATDFNSTGLEVESSYQVSSRLEDPVTLASFNRTEFANSTVSIEGLEDTMLLLRSKGKYVSQYEECSFEKPAEKLETGSTHSTGSVHGEAELNPSDASGIDNRSEKIIVADDIDSYDVAEVNNFAGAVSAQPNSSSGYDNEYVFDTGSISGIKENMSLILNSGEVWRSSFRKMFEKGCYIQSPRGPDFFGRLGNQLETDGRGIATLLNVPELPSELQETESVVGYAYFNDSAYNDLNDIKGVASEYSWFKLDDFHVDHWDIESLAS